MVLKPAVTVFCDFDGTITKQDVTDLLLTRLADPAWHEIEARWERGEIGSRECMTRQISLIKGGWKAIKQVLEEVEIDSTFRTFARWCAQERVRLVIVSDGLDRVIEHVLKTEEIVVDGVFANQLLEEKRKDGKPASVSLRCDGSQFFQACQSGVCKCEILRAAHPDTFRVIIGDGRSDYCWSPGADLIFAKASLATHCEEKGLSYVRFKTFADIQSALNRVLTAENLSDEISEAVSDPDRLTVISPTGPTKMGPIKAGIDDPS